MSEPSVEPTYRDLEAYTSFKDGDAAEDDVRVESPEGEASETETSTSATAEASAVQPEEPVDEGPTPTKEAVSEAARVLSHQKNETRREKRIRQIQEEIDRETARKATAKSEADAEEQRLATLRAQRGQLEAAQPPVPAQTPVPAQPAPAAPAATVRPVAPNPADVGSEAIPDLDAYMAKTAEYVAKMADYSVSSAEQAARAAVAAERQRAEGDAVHRDFDARVQAARVKHPDFDDVVFRNPNLHVGRELADFITQDPDPAATEAAYYLGTHEAESHRIARLSLPAQFAEFGRLKSILSLPVAAPQKATGPQPTAKPVSKTPAPVPPVGPASVSSQVPTERLTLAQFAARRNAEEAESGRL